MYDIIVIGAGTAGLSAAVYAARAGKSVLILEGKMYGGQIINTPLVENYPGIPKISGVDFARSLYGQATGQGAEFKNEQALSVQIQQNGLKKVTVKNGEYLCKSIIIAAGTTKRNLEVPGETKFAGKGVSYCATCDGAFFKGKAAAVAGGGNTALTDALFLSEYCSEVYIVHRRDTFRGEHRILELLQEKKNVQFVLNSNVVCIQGEQQVHSVVIRNRDTGEEFSLPVSGIFVAIGQKPSNDIFQKIVAMDESGYIQAGEDCHTSAAGIFAAGDCRTKGVRQLATAAADGAVAALEAVLYADHFKNN